LSLAACGGTRQGTTPAASDATGDVRSGIIVAVQGEASVKRAGWQTYAPAFFGALFHKGDLLRLGASGRSTVACADLELAELPPGVSGFPCKTASGQGELVYRGNLAIPTRGEPEQGEYPVVVSPRKTRLLAPDPTLHWAAVPGATSYRVSLQGTDWSTIVEDATELAYPPDAPALEPGTSYRLIVEAGERSSAEEPGAGLGFTFLAADEAQAVRGAEAKIRALGLADTPARLLVANLYANHGLYAEAIELLLPLAGSPEPAVARLQGDLYLGIGLNRQAEESYLKALDLSQGANDPEGQATARAVLGRIYDLLGNRQEAARHWQEALAGYEQLGDKAKITELRGLLAEPGK
jgi:predicted negative regulator of RcsB-dependent stress response